MKSIIAATLVALGILILSGALSYYMQAPEPEWHYYEIRCSSVVIRSRSIDPNPYWLNRPPHLILIENTPGWEIQLAQGNDCVLESRDWVYQMRHN